MKKKNKPARKRVCILAQLCKYIPIHTVSRIARELGDEKKARTFSAWSHVVSLLYAHLSHCISLSDVALRKSRRSLLRGATPPKRNTLSHANTKRNPKLMEQLFWLTLQHLRTQMLKFGPSGRYSGILVDSKKHSESAYQTDLFCLFFRYLPGVSPYNDRKLLMRVSTE